jgi:hypothetical protein
MWIIGLSLCFKAIFDLGVVDKRWFLLLIENA